MRNRTRSLALALLALSVVALPAAPAGAAVPHTVVPGETLWSIAAASNFTTRALAAANGLEPDAPVVLGSTIMIPSVAEAAAAMQQAGMAPAPSAPAPSTAAAPAAPAASARASPRPRWRP